MSDEKVKRLDAVRMEPDAQVVEYLRDLLAAAESGELRAFAGIGDYVGNTVREIRAGSFNNRFEHAGFLLRLAMLRLERTRVD